MRWYMYPGCGNSDLLRIRLVSHGRCVTCLLMQCALAVMLCQQPDQIRHDVMYCLPASVRVLSASLLFDILLDFFLRLAQFASHWPRSPPEHWELAQHVVP